MNPFHIGLILFAIFFVFAALMYAGKLPALVALPLMAAALFIVGGLFYYKVHIAYPGSNLIFFAKEFIRVVIEEGMPRLWTYVITVLLGAVLAEILKSSGVTRAIIRYASELGGDNKIVMCVLLTGATAVLFMSLGGLGAVIMVAGIVLPVLLSIGVQPAVAGCLFLFGMSLGGTFNPVNWAFYIEFLSKNAGMDSGTAQFQLIKFIIPFALFFVFMVVIFIVINTRKGFTSFWAVAAKKKKSEDEQAVGFLAILTPLVPVLLVLGFAIPNVVKAFRLQPTAGAFVFPINTALLIGIIYGLIFTGPGPKGRIQKLTKSLFDGITGAAPVAAVIIGIGMVIRVVWDPAVSTYMEPVLQKVIPSTPVLYVLVFALCAPMALYRGPLNIWGMGSALATVMIATGKLPPIAIMGALYSVGMIQGVSDPTNTHNVWIASHLGEDVQVFTRRTIVYTWVLAVCGLVISAVMYF